MKFGNDLATKIARTLTVVFTVVLILCIWGATAEKEFKWEDYDVFSVVFAGLLFALMVYGWYETAPGRLTEEGVYVRFFIRKRFYAWKDIQQAGILLRNGKQSFYELILVKPGGALRKEGEGETRFILRNLFRLIHIPCREPLLHYIKSCYGPLDFDQRGPY